MITVSHPTGNQFVRTLLASLQSRRLLARYFTTLNVPRFAAGLPAPIGPQLMRRTYDIPGSKITSHPAREIARLLANAAGFTSLTKHGSGWASLDAVCRDLDRSVASWVRRHHAGIHAVHCYEDCADATFRAAANAGIRRIYELPIAYWKTVAPLLDEEAARLPAWEPTLYSTRDLQEKLECKSREIEQAEVVICPSEFVLDSIPEDIRRDKKCVVAKFGSPSPPSCVSRIQPGEKLRILFAGAMTQRKGLADLFAAMNLLHRADIELVVMGAPILPMQFYRDQYSAFIHEPPRPHNAVMQLMQTCDLLVLPSLVEGRALVQQEALACGLPIIVTANAGGSDLVVEGETGFLVPIRSPEKIAGKITWFAERRSQFPAFRAAARRKAMEYGWSEYADTIIAAGGRSS